ncbi:PhzF family phenazine biosynthesis protein [Anaerolineales bacterium HSG6]|nr:PhzF family phenazine biosynthesis protein [Anaerolineales bacterium HSG6]MDM8531625.1 PhzF family phenazine biosynthesis protein [Anaerolineales bacterium HSG25]
MKTLPMMQVDAFTSKAYGGNPCAVIFEADELSTEAMQTIAREMNLSETAFVLRSGVADVRARYFTPAFEIPLAGHPTIATIYALLKTGRLPVPTDQFTIQLQLEAGIIPIEVSEAKSERSLVTMSQKTPQFLQRYDPDMIMPIFGLTSADLLSGATIQTVSTGTPQLMVPLQSLESLKRVRFNVSRYEAIHADCDFFSPHLFVLQGISERGTTFARHFGLPPDTFEDPFTGSATGGMAAYLWRTGLLSEPSFIAEQGHWMHRPGEAQVEVVGSREDIKTVKVGGYAVEVLQGELIPPR